MYVVVIVIVVVAIWPNHNFLNTKNPTKGTYEIADTTTAVTDSMAITMTSLDVPMLNKRYLAKNGREHDMVTDRGP